MKKLPSERDLSRLEKKAHDRLIVLFKQKKLQGMESHLHIGLERIAEKGAFARTFARHLEARGFTGVRGFKRFTDIVNVMDEGIHTLELLRFPSALKFKRGKRKIEDEYLLALAMVEWDHNANQYRSIYPSRLM